jgi:hypothetical protein
LRYFIVFFVSLSLNRLAGIVGDVHVTSSMKAFQRRRRRGGRRRRTTTTTTKNIVLCLRGSNPFEIDF